MVLKKLLIFLAVAVFSLGLASPVISAGMGDEVKGTVTKIEGTKVSVKDMMGDEKTVEPKNPEALSDLKAGDRVALKDGILTKEGGAQSAPSPGSSPSPGTRY